jgi:hypothetical protein
MRLPGRPNPRINRRVALRATLGALLAALALVPAAGAGSGGLGVIVSKGTGRQTFAGGTTGRGVAYGTVFSGGSLVVVDYSEKSDLKVESPVTPTVNADGSRTYVPVAGSRNGLGFRISGSMYRMTITGAGNYNGRVYGRLHLRGKGTLTVNGKKNRWNGPAIKLGKVPKDLRSLLEPAFKGEPPPQQEPESPVVLPPATTDQARTTTG